MVKNQNWQKRVEAADARRKEAKQKKQSKQDKKLYRTWANEFLGMLGRNDELKQVKRIDIWSSVQVEQSNDFDKVPEDTKRRLRATSMDLSVGVTPRDIKSTRRGRSQSFSDNCKKQSHPRSKESMEEQQQVTLLLCKSHFFSNKCLHDTKKGCKYVHYPSYDKTLHQVLRKSSSNVLLETREAASLSDDSTPGAMDMVYHASLDLTSTGEEQALHEVLTGFLSNHSISFANIVYIAMDGILVYDRNREGLIETNDQEFLLLVMGRNALLHRRLSIASDDGGEDTLVNFPGAVLEHILTFLPDTSVAAACRVCHTWHDEIGQDSANLWRHLLQRRNWPLPTTTDESNENERHLFRKAFIKHYTAVRDMAAIQKGLTAIATKKSTNETEMTYQDFSKRNHAPSEPNACASIQVWSSNQVLVAYSGDCSLRLFEASSRGVVGSNEKQCRELVYQSIDPYRNTRLKTCYILDMGLDENYIGCLCHVISEDSQRDPYYLIVVSRDEFLMGESGDADLDLAAVIDIGEAVIHYLLSMENVDHGLLALTDFIQTGGLIEEVDVIASCTLATCGHGRFMVEVSISIPDYYDGDTFLLNHDDENDTFLLDRKLVLFSTEMGAVLWMGESRPLNAAAEDRNVSCIRRPYPGGLESMCGVAVGPMSSCEMKICEIDMTGNVRATESQAPPSSLFVKSKVDDGWTFPSPHALPFRQSILMTENHLITGDLLMSLEQEAPPRDLRSFISFLPRHPFINESSCSTVELPGLTEVCRMACLRDDHVIILCRTYTTISGEPFETAGGGGHWLRGDRPATRIDIVAFIYHIESASQIGQFCLLENVSLNAEAMPCITADSNDTLGVALSWKGLVMTGDAIRFVGDSTTIKESSTPRSDKKKRNGRAKRRAKKDEFARGTRQNSG